MQTNLIFFFKGASEATAVTPGTGTHDLEPGWNILPGPVNRVEIDGASTTLGAAATNIIYQVVEISFSAGEAATFKFTSGGSDFTGDLPLAAELPFRGANASGLITGDVDADLTLAGSVALDGWALIRTVSHRTSSEYLGEGV